MERSQRGYQYPNAGNEGTHRNEVDDEYSAADNASEMPNHPTAFKPSWHSPYTGGSTWRNNLEQFEAPQLGSTRPPESRGQWDNTQLPKSTQSRDQEQWDDTRLPEPAAGVPWWITHRSGHELPQPDNFPRDESGSGQYAQPARLRHARRGTFQQDQSDLNQYSAEPLGLRRDQQSTFQPDESSLRQFSEPTHLRHTRHRTFGKTEEVNLNNQYSQPSGLHRAQYSTSQDESSMGEYSQPTRAHHGQDRTFGEADDGSFKQYSQHLGLRRAQHQTSQEAEEDEDDEDRQYPQLTGLRRTQDSTRQAERNITQDWKPPHLRHIPARYRHRNQAVYFPPNQNKKNESPQESGPLQELPARDMSHHQDAYEQSFEAPASFQPPNVQRNQRSHSARGYYSPGPLDGRPLPQVPVETGYGAEEETFPRDLAREAHEEIQLEEQKRDKNHATRDGLLREYRARGIRKLKSFTDNRSRGAAVEDQSHSPTPEWDLPRQPPPVPAPVQYRQPSEDDEIGEAMCINSSGLSRMGEITERAEATSNAAQEYLKQKELESFFKSLIQSKTKTPFLNCLIELNLKIDQLAVQLWRGGLEGRKLFSGISGNRIRVAYEHVSG